MSGARHKKRANPDRSNNFVTRRPDMQYWQTCFYFKGKPWREKTPYKAWSGRGKDKVRWDGDLVKAIAWAEERKKQLEGGHQVSKDGRLKTLSEAIAETVELRWGNKDTCHSARRCQKLIPVIGDKLMGEVTEKDIVNLVKTLSEKGLDPIALPEGSSQMAINAQKGNKKKPLKGNTINRYLSALHTVFTTNKVPVPCVFPWFDEDEYNRKRILTEEEEDLYSNYLLKRFGLEHYVMFFILIDNGIRIGEANRITKNHLELSKAILHMDNRYGEILEKDGKPRNIKLTARSVKLIEMLINQNPPEQEKLFKSPRARWFDDAWRTMKKDLGINDPELVPHSLRHTKATRMVDLVELKIVSEQLGHKSIKTTEKYSHVRDEMLANATAKYEAIYSGVGQEKINKILGNVTQIKPIEMEKIKLSKIEEKPNKVTNINDFRRKKIS